MEKEENNLPTTNSELQVTFNQSGHTFVEILQKFQIMNYVILPSLEPAKCKCILKYEICKPCITGKNRILFWSVTNDPTRLRTFSSIRIEIIRQK